MSQPSASRLDRALRIAADVRAGEGATVTLLAVNLLLILLAYYTLKPIREALILGEWTPSVKSYLSAASVAVLMLVVPLYARLASALPRMRLIRLVTWFFIVCLMTFYVLARFDVRLGIPYFLWLGVFNLMIAAQFWSFANDLYTKAEGERLFPVVGFGGALGAVLGSVLAARLIERVGLYEALLIGAVGLWAQLQLTGYIDRREGRRLAATAERRTAVEQPIGGHGAFALVLRNRYLLGIGLMVLVLYQIDSTGEFLLGTFVKNRATEMVAAGQSDGLSVEALIGRFYSRYFALVNIGSVAIQFLLVSRIVRSFGVGRAVCILPVMSALAYSTIIFVPHLMLVLSAAVTNRATDYSLNNTVRNMLFLPCSREEKYSAKQVIDSVFVRMGDLLSAFTVFLGTAVLGWSATGFAKCAVVMAGTAFGLAVIVGRGYRRMTIIDSDRTAASLGGPRAAGLAAQG